MESGCNDSDAALIRDMLTLPERKEAEVLAGLLSHREHQVHAAQSRFAGLRRHIEEVCCSTTASASPLAPRQLEEQARREWRLAHRRESTEVAALPWASESVSGTDASHCSPSGRRGLLVEGGSPDTTERQPSAAYNALVSLREKDRLLSLGLDWLTAELEDARTQVRQLTEMSESQELCMQLGPRTPDVPDGRDRELMHVAACLHEKSSAEVDEIIHEEVLRFLDRPEGRRCRVLLCCLGPRAYLYGSQRLDLRLCALTGQLEARLEDHGGGTWSAFGPLLAGLDGAQHDLTQHARAITHVVRADVRRTHRGVAQVARRRR